MVVLIDTMIMSPSNQLQNIIELLNSDPFNYTETLISLTCRSPHDKIQLLNNVIAYFDNKHTNVNLIQSELPETTAARLLDYLTNTIKYTFEHSDDAITLFDMNNDNSDVIYHILYYILNNQSLIQQRSYIARYMRSPDISTDYIHDTQIQSLLQQLQSLQQTWKSQHQTIQNIQSSPPVHELQSEITRSNNEKSQIKNKIQQLHSQIRLNTAEYDSNVFNEILRYTNLIRLQQEDEEQLYNYAIDIKSKLDAVQSTQLQLESQLQQLQQNDGSGDEHALCHQLQQLIQSKQRDIKQLDQSNRSLSKQCHSLHSLVDGGTQLMNENDVSNIQQYYNDITHNIEHVQQSIQQIYSTSNDLDLYVKRLASNNDRFIHLNNKCTELNQEQIDGQNELDTLQDQLNQFNHNSNAASFSSQAQYEQFTAQLNIKTNEYNYKKQQLDELNDTVDKYRRMISVLNTNVTNKSTNEHTAEVQQILVNARSIQQQYLAESIVSQQHNNLTATSNTGELHKMYNTLCMQIKNYRQALQPSIDELKDVRQQYTEYKNTYLEQCNLYKLQQLQYSSDTMKYDTQVQSLSSDLVNEQKIKSDIDRLVTELMSRTSKLQQEVKYESGIESYNTQYKTYVQYCLGESNVIDDKIRELQNEKLHYASMYDTAVQSKIQFTLFNDLLQLKLRLRRGNNDKENSYVTGYNTHNAI